MKRYHAHRLGTQQSWRCPFLRMPKLIYRLSTISVTIPVGLYDKLILKWVLPPLPISWTPVTCVLECLIWSHRSFFIFWLRRLAREILVPRPGIEPVPLQWKLGSSNHWTAREFPPTGHFFSQSLFSQYFISGSFYLYAIKVTGIFFQSF